MKKQKQEIAENQKSKTKAIKEHLKISVFLRFDQIEYLTKEHIELNNSNMSLVVRNAVDVFIEKEKKQKLAVLKKIIGNDVYEKLSQLSIEYEKEIEATIIELIELNFSANAQNKKVIIDQFDWKV
ncbi:hypothetical protein [Janthinobacterium aquaticum]|uniref:hypothetical protein n=1 Tax=Janthinobacterium sp. FT58W TaxID=2654254 RepID=UPI0012650146|nr:hypothetical protein [Janthinobacterium sp. FT58W]KAB8042976.1 hypothetical protein GCM43_10085 [Janthinobacterium sp. FT58W]